MAADAGVDPALVHHYFGSKDDLFVAALELPLDPRAVIAPVAGRRRRRRGGAAADASSSACGTTRSSGRRLLGVVRGVLEPEGQRLIRDGLPAGGASARRPRRSGVDQPERRMPFVASQMFGLILARYVLDDRAAGLDAGRRRGGDVAARARDPAERVPRRAVALTLDRCDASEASGIAEHNSTHDE